MDLLRLVENLHAFTRRQSAAVLVKHLDTILAAAGGQVSSTKLEKDKEIWRVETAAYAAVWRLQNPSRPFEALTAAVLDSVT